jgi:high-affinity K+ transport system ATPase subunit B
MGPNKPVLIKKGELIPFDGVVLEGFAFVDESAICGVSTPAMIDSEAGRNQVYKDGLIVEGWLKIVQSVKRAA